ncbi:ABC transporter permease [Dactylosporangium sp. AC04546]|uniref:ABC transporter permease n=1 Tax=Dactylosporangium sp. AC04546 TaxID=2862460 RepID=UPI001EE0C341|nr:ABC transporter permease [Dactylosporangium sp. AC04546]WVK86545.1 ABC transporter permease [Dactylosporangium sp. AC04546]
MSRLAAGDVLRLGAAGLRARPSRAALSALGIAIGIAAMLAVVGISGSGRADLRQTLDALGTNLLRVTAADDAVLPDGAVGMIERIGPVTGAAALRKLPDDMHVYRNDRVPAQQTNGIVPFAVDLDLTETVGATVARGAWLNPATADFPAVVLGAESARRLGITTPDPRMVVRIGSEGFTVVGILAPVTLLPELDSTALIGAPAARTYLGTEAHPTTIYLRTADAQVTAVRDVLASTANPAAPYEVAVSRPSDALAARLATERAFNGLLLGLGAVALLVGGVGVANTMVITVLERRAEIGLRRSLGATRGQIRLQFLTEAALLSTLGGVAGAVLGVLVTAAYAVSRNWPIALPASAVLAGIGATVIVGAVAGLYPAVRAAQLAPTEALTAV